MQIFQATKLQLKIIQNLAYKIWPKAYAETKIITVEQMEYMLDKFYSIEALEKQFDMMNHVFLLVQENNVFLGFALFEMNCNQSGKAKLHKLYLLPENQGKGLGKLLVKKIEKTAKMANNSHLFLNVNKYNSAKKFYENLDFRITEEEVIDIGQGYVMDDYVMEKELK